MVNTTGHAELDSMIDALRTLGAAMTDDAAPHVAEALRTELAQSVAAGTTPEGQAWEPRRSDERAPLQNAMNAVGVAAVRSKIFVRLSGVEARHHRGRVKGGTPRQIIPVGKLPDSWARAIKRTLDERFAAWKAGQR